MMFYRSLLIWLALTLTVFGASPSTVVVDASTKTLINPSTSAFKLANGIQTQASILDQIIDRDGTGLTSLSTIAVPQLNAEANAYQAVDNKIAGLTANSTTLKVFSTEVDTGTPSYVRSTTLWAYNSLLDMSGISPYNSESAGQKAGVLLTPNIIWMANHFLINPTHTIRFVSPSGAYYDRTIVSAVQIGGSDIEIGKLDSPLPSDIQPVKLLPADYASHINIIGLPVAYTDQHENLFVGDISSLSLGGSGAPNSVFIESPGESQRLIFYTQWMGGDSGDPAFLIYNNQVVVIGLGHFPDQAEFITPNLSGVQAAITSLGGTGALSFVTFPTAGQVVKYSDIASFPTNRFVPAGGTTGQVLVKNSNADNDVSFGSPGVSTPWTLVSGKPFSLATIGGNGSADAGQALLFDTNGAIRARTSSGTSSGGAINGFSSVAPAAGIFGGGTGTDGVLGSSDSIGGVVGVSTSGACFRADLPASGTAHFFDARQLGGLGGTVLFDILPSGALSWPSGSGASLTRTNLGLGTMATQAASAVAITGGTVNGTSVGATTAAAVSGTTIRAGGAGAIATTGIFEAYIDASNYLNFSSGVVTIQRAGQTISYDPNAGGGFGGAGSMIVFNNANGMAIGVGNPHIYISGSASGTVGNVGIGNTSPGTKLDVTGAIRASTYLMVTPVHVSALPAAATAGKGARAFVDDATTPAWGVNVTGGSSSACPVFSDGANWKAGG